MSHSCAQWRGEIGAYIVGALDDRDAAAVHRHLAVCPGCRAEYEELVPVRGWLSRLARPKPARSPRRPDAAPPPRPSTAPPRDLRRRIRSRRPGP